MHPEPFGSFPTPTRLYPTRSELLALATLTLLACGCSKENNVSLDTYNGQRIGPSGGVVDGPDGVELRVPAGAVAEDTLVEIGVAEPGEYPTLTNGYEFRGKVYAFTPHGTSFLSPVILSLPDPGDASSLLRAELNGSWAPLASDFIAQRAEASITRFSFYAAAREASTIVDEPTCSGRGADLSSPSGTLQGFTGVADLNGTSIDFTGLVDGFADMDEAGRLALTFTPYPNACGHHKNGVAPSGATQLVVQRMLSGAATTTTYPPNDLVPMLTPIEDRGGMCLFGAGSEANAGEPPTGGGLSIAAVDPAHIVGSIDYSDEMWGSVSGSFDLPFCSAQPNLNPPSCCVGG